MLKQLRNKKTAKRIFFFLALIIVPAFVLWGSGSLIRDKSKSNFAGEIFGKKVPIDVYRDCLMAVRDQAIIQFGENFNQIQGMLNLEERAWERLILLTKAKQEKIRISDKEVVEQIADFPFFQKDGKFNEQIYQQVLRYGLGTTAKIFEQHIRESLMISELFKKATQNIIITDEEVLSEFKRENEKIKVALIAFNNRDFEVEVSASPEETKDYFDKNKENFLLPASINIEYIGANLSPDSTAEQKQEAKDKLSSILELAKKDNDWKALSEKSNLTFKNTGLFSIEEPIPGIGWSNEFFQAILPLKPGEVSDIIATEAGFFLARLLEKVEPRIPEFSEVENKVSQEIKKEKAKELSLAKAENFKKIIEEKLKQDKVSEFKKIANELNLKTSETDFFKRSQYIDNIGMSFEFSQKAFSLLDKPSALETVTTPQASYIMKLAGVMQVDMETFKKENVGYRGKLAAGKKEEAFFSLVQKLKNEAHLKSYITNITPP
ncbi:MAG: SurA N-terminal domain-containing protein [Candidatus Omnitrophota bacterium]